MKCFVKNSIIILLQNITQFVNVHPGNSIVFNALQIGFSLRQIGNKELSFDNPNGLIDNRKVSGVSLTRISAIRFTRSDRLVLQHNLIMTHKPAFNSDMR